MLGKTKKTYFIAVLTLLLSFGVLHIVQAVTAASAEPGTDMDPIVSQSYVDQKFDDAVKKINQLSLVIEDLNSEIEALESKVKSLTAQLEDQKKYATFQVIELKAGQQLVSGESAEIIVRAGKATAVSGVNGDGLSDITDDNGKSLYTGDEIPLNHLLLVSRNDGRGIKAVSNQVFILFKGTYEIK
jgi:uncharacterized protein YlxW (UPF0749 family)